MSNPDSYGTANSSFPLGQLFANETYVATTSTTTTPESCSSGPCMNGGCLETDEYGMSTCQCPTGFTGNMCETTTTS